MKRQLATALFDDWQRAFDAHQVKGGYSPDPVSAGRRALANLSLAMLCLAARQSGDAVWPGRAWQRFKDAGNMTDRQGALLALLDSGSVLADAALERFHAMFRNDPLALDKWFALQAGASEHEGRVFERARRLLAHSDFHLSNPNRARSLVGTLCIDNPAAFHRADGAGYAFWAERVIALDAINPQLASRMARALDRWSHLAEPYRSAARAAIERVSAQTDAFRRHAGDRVARPRRSLTMATSRKPRRKNAFYAQSGGVTAVINASAAGVIETARAHRDAIGKVYAGRNGIIGALTEDLIDTSKESAAAIKALRTTPSGAFGSCRYKLKSLETNRREYERLIEVFQAHDIG